MRTETSIKNIIFAYCGQVAGILINLVARLVFVRILSAEYLGLNGLFTNILSVLCLVELGVGPAMTFSLYKPLAENNKEKVKSLMLLYKKAYIIIGILIFIIGISLTPFLPNLIDSIPDINNINLIYILFVVNTSVSYFFSYKRSLIISDQKRYIATIYRYGFYFILNLLQIIVLLITKNYILYLLVQIGITLAENISVSRKADKMYPYLKDKNISKLPKEDKTTIKKNILAMIMHKIGGIVVNSTDNILISKYVGLVWVGIYSNYYLITNALNIIMIQIFTSITASIGNLAATENKEKVYNIFKKIFFINFWLYGFSSICLIMLYNNFIQIWLGKEYLLDILIVGIIVINFYITGMRKAVLTFKEALGLYWQDRYKAIIEAIINLVVSIILVKNIGLIGVFIGTLISTLTTCFWIEPYVLYKHAFKRKLLEYFKKYFLYTLVTIIAGYITFLLCNVFSTVNILNLIIKLIICIIVPNIIFIALFYKTEEFKYFKDLIINIIKNIKDKILKRK